MHRALTFALPLLLALPAGAHAAAFYDRDAFNAAVSGIVNDDLNALPNGTIDTVFGVETIASGGNPVGVSVAPYSSGTFGQALGGAGPDGNFDSLIFTFTAPIYAFGFDDLDLTPTEFANIRVTLQGGASRLFNISETDSDFATAAFFGYASSTALQSVEIWSANSVGGPVGERANRVDNLAISRTPLPGVPEPATWALMLAGFGAAGAMLRRRRAAHA